MGKTAKLNTLAQGLSIPGTVVPRRKAGGSAVATKTKKKKAYGSPDMTITGDLRIVPPLAKIPDELHPVHGDASLIGKDDADEDVVLLADGSIGVVGDPCTLVECRYSDRFSDTDFHLGVKQVIDAAVANNSVVNGVFQAHDFHEIQDRPYWRVVVHNNTITYEEPQLVWPDGTTQNLSS